jgi:hypothetical protein
MFPAMEDLPQILTTEAGWTPKYEKIVHIDDVEDVPMNENCTKLSILACHALPP